jgi:hypothetical protein
MIAAFLIAVITPAEKAIAGKALGPVAKALEPAAEKVLGSAAAHELFDHINKLFAFLYTSSVGLWYAFSENPKFLLLLGLIVMLLGTVYPIKFPDDDSDQKVRLKTLGLNMKGVKSRGNPQAAGLLIIATAFFFMIRAART